MAIWSKPKATMAKNYPNLEREQRILKSASKLFVHFGFDKTTVSDIARDAGVSKGAIYLHFESKDALLEALIIQELKMYAEKWLELLEADPQGGTIGGMYKNSLYALSASEFMAAIYKKDGHILGNYLRKPGNFFQTFDNGKEESDRLLFVSMMQAAGALRKELDPNVVAHIMDLLAYGLVSINEVKPENSIPPVEDVIEGIAELMDRALTPADGGNPEAGKEIIRQLANASREAYEASISQAE
jgi:TetR/AcrR family acrAB operon transcriptional repressor